MTTLKEVKEKLSRFSTHSVKKGIFTVRRSFFYRMGNTATSCANHVKEVFPDAEILDYGEVWKDFRGGQSVAQGSHWWVKFSFGDKK